MCKTLERIKQFIDCKGLSVSAFEKSVGMSNASFGKSLKNKGAIGTDKLENILKVYPELSATWLLTGRGDTLKQTSGADGDPSRASKDLDTGSIDRTNPGATRPRIPFTAAAGGLSMVAQTATTGECEQVPVIPTFPPYDFTIIIEGDSMAPLYLSGDELACRFVYGADEINWGKPYIVDSDEGAVFKLLYDGGNVVLCRSINPEGPTYEINKRDIHHVAAIVGYLRHTL